MAKHKAKRHSAGGKGKKRAKAHGGKMPLEVRQHFAALTKAAFEKNQRAGIKPIFMKRKR